jgi:1-aminocyclopropane-1-carboxylate deaminase/D-cysteine desulfhydrase-like pyridoxal-dependent ACC family enzyme
MSTIFSHKAPTPLQAIYDATLTQHGIELFVKRDDLIDTHISGNKWRKLKYNLMSARNQGYHRLLTFGGAYSNHIYATAAAGLRWGFETVGIIRGEAHWPLNATLRFAKHCGMTLYYLNRTHYRQKENPALLAELQDRFGDFYLLPEGGTNLLALQGCGEIVTELLQQTGGAFDVVTTPCGTGGTLAGLANYLPTEKTALGFPVLKNGDFLADDIRILLGATDPHNWRLYSQYHCGGYAKCPPELQNFMDTFTAQHGIPLDPIYTAKMLFGLYDLVVQQVFPPGTRIVALHTGGLQGSTSNRFT